MLFRSQFNNCLCKKFVGGIQDEKNFVPALILGMSMMLSACGKTETGKTAAAPAGTSAETAASSAEATTEAAPSSAETATETASSHAAPGDVLGTYFYTGPASAEDIKTGNLATAVLSKSGDECTMTLSGLTPEIQEVLGLSGTDYTVSLDSSITQAVNSRGDHLTEAEIDGQSYNVEVRSSDTSAFASLGIGLIGSTSSSCYFAMTFQDNWYSGLVGEFVYESSYADDRTLTVGSDGTVAYTGKDGVSYTGKLEDTVPVIPVALVEATGDDGKEYLLALSYDISYETIEVQIDDEEEPIYEGAFTKRVP